MENQKNNKVVIVLLGVIILILLALCILFATGTISLKSNNVVNDNGTNESLNNNDNEEANISNSNNNEETDDKVNINLLIGDATIYKDAPNSKILIDGTINLSYNSSKYAGVTLSGYCLGANNEKYRIWGPGVGRVLFQNGDNSELTLTEVIPQNVEYTDGTVKTWSEIDWENVKIKYCKIDKMTAILNEGTNHQETTLNIEKNFN